MAFLPHVPDRDSTAELGKVVIDGRQLTAIVFPGQRQNTRSWIQIVAGVAAVSVLFLLVAGQSEGQRSPLTVLVLLLLVGLVVWTLWLTWRDLPRVAISSLGVHAGNRSQVFVPWDVIDDVEPYDSAFNTGLKLSLTSLDGVRQPALGRATSRALSTPSVVLPLVRGRADEAASMITHYIIRPDERSDLEAGRLPSDINLLHHLEPSWRRRTMSGLWMAWILVALIWVLVIGALALARLLS